ncbi:MAG TPA: sulfatase-like hydrolase/transferase [Patescibacteria group bacterium]|jgi:hypothetical protein
MAGRKQPPVWKARLSKFLPGIVVAAFAIMPVFGYLKTNFTDLQPGGTLGLLLFAVLVGAVLWGIGWLATRDWRRGAVVGVLLTFPFFHYKELLDWFVASVTQSRPRTVILVGVLILAALIGWGLRKLSDKTIRTVLSYLGVVAVIFFAWNGVGMIQESFKNAGTSVRAVNDDLTASPRTAAPKDSPDIYYLVFDRYTGSIGLSESYDFDNGKFLTQLQRRGFYVPKRSFANYPVTASSVSSSLNGGPLATKGPVDRAETAKPLYKLLQRPAVPAYLQDRGYEFVQLGSWWGPTMRSQQADRNPLTAWMVEVFGIQTHFGDLSGVFINKTAFPDLFTKLPSARTTLYDNHGPAFQSQVTQTEDLAAERGGKPKFVFTHFLMPHPPYIYDRDGDRLFPRGLSGWHRYLRQLEYTNDRILEMVDTIRKRDPHAIVILQADEGEYPKRFAKDAKPSDAQIRQKTNVLNAYYFPGEDYDALYDSITPVNTFRIVLNQFFGTDLAKQPDVTHTLGGRRNYLDFVDVTDIVRAEPGPPGSGNPAIKPTLPGPQARN